jgi:hypothetical protein
MFFDLVFFFCFCLMTITSPDYSLLSPDFPHSLDPLDIWSDMKAPLLYSRVNALASDALKDVTEVGKAYGYPFPVALSHRLWWDICGIPLGSPHTELDRVGDVLRVGRLALCEQETSLLEDTPRTLYFELPLAVAGKDTYSGDMYTVKMMVASDEFWNPTYTLLKPGECLYALTENQR